jgi:hypothetical protein
MSDWLYSRADQRAFRDQTADLYFRRIHRVTVLNDIDCSEHIRIDYMRTPRGYDADCEWIVPGTLDLEA